MINDMFYVLRELYFNKNITQREMSKKINCSVGKVNKLFSELINQEFINQETGKLTMKASNFIQSQKVDNAIILAAGFGSRFIPLTYETPKGLLEVKGERMIERQIRQLHDVGIKDITIVVGYLKEKFEYLIDKYGVDLIYCADYHSKNNLASLFCVRHKLKNSYILSSDNYMTENLFNSYENLSWYSCNKAIGHTKEWCLELSKAGRISGVTIGGTDKWYMYGPVFFDSFFSEKMVSYLEQYYSKEGTDNFYWEHILKNEIEEFEMYAHKNYEGIVYEFESLDELRVYDKTYIEQSKCAIIDTICRALNISRDDITNIKALKTGMTNKSFTFDNDEQTFICRIPGEGTDKLINRNNEYESYNAISKEEISDQVVYFNPDTGIKISRFMKDVVPINILKTDEVEKAMQILYKLHNSDITVDHEFNILEQISLYEKLCVEKDAILYEDYFDQKKHIDVLIQELSSLSVEKALCHIDAVSDNFVINDIDEVYLIDWEYAGMADPIIDIAMYSIYSYLEKDEINSVLELYLNRKPTRDEKFRLYAYVSLGGLLWSLWSLYKQSLGVVFGDYGLKMYRYFKAYYQNAMELKRGESIE